jgi:hypothetical protein
MQPAATPTASVQRYAVRCASGSFGAQPKARAHPATITIKPAAGPLIVSCELLIQGVIKPPRIAVMTPATGGKQLALAIARQSGRAMRNTRKPAVASNRKRVRQSSGSFNGPVVGAEPAGGAVGDIFVGAPGRVTFATRNCFQSTGYAVNLTLTLRSSPLLDSLTALNYLCFLCFQASRGEPQGEIIRRCLTNLSSSQHPSW